jgi:hypothetical protein
MQELSQEIASQAARLIVEEGLDYGAAKRRAAKDMGLPANKTPMPSNDLLEQELRIYISIFCPDTQPLELAALRAKALEWMQRLEYFRPHLSGAVWRGTATRLSDIYIQLFCDDSKEAEIELINQGVNFEVRSVIGFRGKPVDALSISTFCEELQEEIGLHLMIYDHDDLRGALVSDQKQKSGRQTHPDQSLIPLGPQTPQTLKAPALPAAPTAPIGSLKALKLLLGD